MAEFGDGDLYKAGTFLFMSDVENESCKEAIEFILRQNTETKKIGCHSQLWSIDIHYRCQGTTYLDTKHLDIITPIFMG